MSKINPKTVTSFANVLRQTASEGVDASSPAEIVPLTLISLDPMKWRKGVELPLPRSCVILPRGLGFDTQDLNKTFLFIQARRGKRFFFLCEREVKSGGSNT